MNVAVKSLPTLALVAGITLLVSSCSSTAVQREYKHTYKLLYGDTYFSGADKCKQQAEELAKKEFAANRLEVIDSSHNMSIDMQRGVSMVECTIVAEVY